MSERFNIEQMAMRDLFYKAGHNAWERSYRLQPGDDCNAAKVGCDVVGEQAERLEWVSQLRESKSLARSVACQAKWVDGGCRIIETDAKYFSAMAHTSLSKDAAGDLIVPWPSFFVEWPEGLCVNEEDYDYRSALVSQLDDLPTKGDDGEIRNVPWSFLYLSGKRCDVPSLTVMRIGTLVDLLFGEDPPEWTSALRGEPVRTKGDLSIQEMVKKAIVGLLYTMQHTNNWRPSKFSSPVQRGSLRSAPPPHRSIIVGRPISIDATKSVSERAAGRVGSPSVQTLVRGHIKRQVVGLGRSGRKVIWIEPYWRGPEDAPILTRPYKVGSA